MKIKLIVICLILWSSCTDYVILNEENISIQDNYEYETIELQSDIPIILSLYDDGVYVIENDCTYLVKNKNVLDAVKEIMEREIGNNGFGNSNFYQELKKKDFDVYTDKSILKFPKIEDEIEQLHLLRKGNKHRD